MDEWLRGLEPIVEHQDLQVPYRYSLGPTASKFFSEIRDHKKIMGIRCPKCDLVYVPPRSTCGRCFSSLKDWVEVSQQGTLETFTRVNYSTPVQPVPAPFYYGIVKLDGADTGLPHLIGQMGDKQPRVGMRLQAVFKEERAGNMLDILYFKPIPQGGKAKVEAKPKAKGKVEVKVKRKKAKAKTPRPQPQP